MMELWLALLISLVAVLVAMGCVGLGYAMGRNSAERPVVSDLAPSVSDEELEDTIPGDVFDTAMSDDDDARVSTLR